MIRRSTRTPETHLSPSQLEALASKIAEKIITAQDEMMPLAWVCREKGLSKSYVYHNIARLGGVKNGGKWFFSKRNLEALLREGYDL